MGDKTRQGPSLVELRDMKQEIADVIGCEGKDEGILATGDLRLFLEMESIGQRKICCKINWEMCQRKRCSL